MTDQLHWVIRGDGQLFRSVDLGRVAGRDRFAVEGSSAAYCAADDAVVVEHSQRTDTHLLLVSVPVEGEVPPGLKPAAIGE